MQLFHGTKCSGQSLGFRSRGALIPKATLPAARRASVKELGFCEAHRVVGKAPDYKFKTLKI